MPLVQELPYSRAPWQIPHQFPDWGDPVLLESALERDRVGRYSFFTADPVERHSVERVRFGEDPLQPIREAIDRNRSTTLAGLPPFQGGAIGILGYEAGRAWEQLPPRQIDEFQIPDVSVGIYDWVIAWDHLQRKAWIIVQDLKSPQTTARDRLKEIERRLQTPAQTPRPEQRSRKISLSGKSFPLLEEMGVFSNFSREGYIQAVQRVREYLFAGDIFQANLSQRLVTQQRTGLWPLYEKLRARNPAPFAACLVHDDWGIVSASPERFLAVRQREVETRPIKGTRRRQVHPAADLFTRDELRESEKDLAENRMIVDLLRNDLSRVCAPHSIRIPQLCQVELYETVQHLVSEIRGTLRPEYDPLHLLQATFPGGSITGAPKIRAMEIIAELEPHVRGPYCGTLFSLGFDGTLDSSILIRTFVQRGGWLQFSVGGGIVVDSDPELEYAETLQKASGLLRALELPTETSAT